MKIKKINKIQRLRQDAIMKSILESRKNIEDLEKEIKETKNKIRKYNKILLRISPFLILLLIIITGFDIKNILNAEKTFENIFLFGFIVLVNIGMGIYWIYSFNYYKKRVKKDKIEILKEMVEELSEK